MRLNQVTVPAHDLRASIGFYTALGLKQIVDSPHYARFEVPEGEATFSLHLADENRPVGDTVVYFECADLDDVCAGLQDAGITLDSGPEDQSWLWREARLKDPAGNEICLYFAGDNRLNPPWRINPE